MCKNATDFMEVDIYNFEQRKKLTALIEAFGTDIIQKSAGKNSMLESTVGGIYKMGEAGIQVAQGLDELTIRLKELNPAQVNFSKEGMFGKLFNPAKKYFAKLKKADEEIINIIKKLNENAIFLKHDNITLEIELKDMYDLNSQLNEKIEDGMCLRNALADMTEEIKKKANKNNEDIERIKFLEEDVLLSLRQRILDFEQMLAVNQQGIIAMEIIYKNNKELISSVEKADNLTVSAFKVAVLASNALNQKKILSEKVNSMNEAFSQAYAELDEIGNYKQETLPKVRQAIDEYKVISKESEKVFHRICN